MLLNVVTELVHVLGIREVVAAVVGAVLGAVPAARLAELWDKRQIREEYRELFNFDPKGDIFIVFPTTGPVGGRERGAVAWEDMRAVEYMRRCLLDAGIPRKRIKFRGLERFDKPLREMSEEELKCLRREFRGWPSDNVVQRGIAYPKLMLPSGSLTQEEFALFGLLLPNQVKRESNFIMICSPKSNHATQQAIADLGLDWSMQPDPDTPVDSEKPWWKLLFYGGLHESRAFREPDSHGELHDTAVIAKMRSPWNRDRTVLFAFGVRAIGTWGAARHFYRAARRIHQMFGTDDFACLISVTYSSTELRILPEFGITNAVRGQPLYPHPHPVAPVR